MLDKCLKTNHCELHGNLIYFVSLRTFFLFGQNTENPDLCNLDGRKFDPKSMVKNMMDLLYNSKSLGFFTIRRHDFIFSGKPPKNPTKIITN